MNTLVYRNRSNRNFEPATRVTNSNSDEPVFVDYGLGRFFHYNLVSGKEFIELPGEQLLVSELDALTFHFKLRIYSNFNDPNQASVSPNPLIQREKLLNEDLTPTNNPPLTPQTTTPINTESERENVLLYIQVKDSSKYIRISHVVDNSSYIYNDTFETILRIESSDYNREIFCIHSKANGNYEELQIQNLVFTMYSTSRGQAKMILFHDMPGCSDNLIKKKLLNSWEDIEILRIGEKVITDDSQPLDYRMIYHIQEFRIYRGNTYPTQTPGQVDYIYFDWKENSRAISFDDNTADFQKQYSSGNECGQDNCQICRVDSSSCEVCYFGSKKNSLHCETQPQDPQIDYFYPFGFENVDFQTPTLNSVRLSVIQIKFDRSSNSFEDWFNLNYVESGTSNFRIFTSPLISHHNSQINQKIINNINQNYFTLQMIFISSISDLPSYKSSFKTVYSIVENDLYVSCDSFIGDSLYGMVPYMFCANPGFVLKMYDWDYSFKLPIELTPNQFSYTSVFTNNMNPNINLQYNCLNNCKCAGPTFSECSEYLENGESSKCHNGNLLFAFKEPPLSESCQTCQNPYCVNCKGDLCTQCKSDLFVLNRYSELDSPSTDLLNCVPKSEFPDCLHYDTTCHCKKKQGFSQVNHTLYFADFEVCEYLKCPRNCKSCSDNSSCNQCKTQRFQFENTQCFLLKDYSKPGFLFSQDSIYPIPSNCTKYDLMSNSTEVECFECRENYNLNSNKCLHKLPSELLQTLYSLNKTISNCVSQISSKCTVCSDGYYLLQNYCVKCPPNSTSCSFNSNTNRFTKLICVGNYIFNKKINSCTLKFSRRIAKICEKGFFLDPKTNKCLNCGDNCLFCQNPTFCLKCKSMFTLNLQKG